MRMWGPSSHSYTWGLQGIEPDPGTSSAPEVFCVGEIPAEGSLSAFDEVQWSFDWEGALSHNELHNQELAVVLQETEVEDLEDGDLVLFDDAACAGEENSQEESLMLSFDIHH